MIGENFKSGFVAIIGRPNAGKSTILNALLNAKISIVSAVPQTTRHRIKGILNTQAAQIVFVDTPGMHSFRDSLARQLNTVAQQSIEGCDLILYVIDISRPFGKEESEIIDFLISQDIKIITALNKIDLGEKFIADYISFWKHKISEKKIEKDPNLYYLPLSAKTGKNMDKLEACLIENLNIQPPFYDLNALTDFPLKFRIADVIREKLFLKLEKELPHSLAVEVETIEDRNENISEEEKERLGQESLISSEQKFSKGGFIYIKVNIYVNRLSQKKIVIGKNGQAIKEIGISSRKELETILGKRIYLDMAVKVLADWQDKPRILQELGYWVG
jgi:GTP-binding protein Era